MNVVPIKIPNLNERVDDIPILAKHFSKKLSSSNGLTFREFTEEALTVLQGMNWPGNIRQLKNLIERINLDSAKKIGIDELISSAKTQENSGEINLISQN